ncbi:hypothetical protein Scep_002418 [Stephania cephalantha]|uniref:t-SNARE coiled-coil homology domain-containing protein n=1 Tax=Stephania cephalantha TaxID=152367 RepID=A0AAP0Q4A0_9MAGN
MFGFMKSPQNKVAKQETVDPGFVDHIKSKPLNSDVESDVKKNVKPSRRTASDSAVVVPNDDLSDDDDYFGKRKTSTYSVSAAAKNKYKNDFGDSGGFENQSVQELQNYAAYKSEETTNTVNNCLKIAEDIKDDAANTLATLQKQGEQITRTHQMTVDIDHDLSRGEKLLGSLGGMFSKTWKPKKTRAITGPVISKDDSFKRRGNQAEQRQKLGLAPAPKGATRKPHSEPKTAMQKVEVEKAKQDDALNDLSDILGDLKVMANDMGSELERQNEALDHLSDDVDELNFRMKGANQRGRHLLSK